MKKIILVLLSFLFVVVKSQNYEWAKMFPNGVTVTGLHVDHYRNIFVAGTFTGSADFDFGAGNTTLSSSGAEDCFIAMYDPTLKLVWAKSFGGNGNEKVSTMYRNQGGDMYVTGSFDGLADFDPGSGSTPIAPSGSNNTDAFLVKFDNFGDFKWVRNIASGGRPTPICIREDHLGRIIIGFMFSGITDFDSGTDVTSYSGTFFGDVAISTHDNKGNYLWSMKLRGTEGVSLRDIDINSKNNVCVLGEYRDSIDFDPKVNTNMGYAGPGNMPYMFIAKYDAGFNLISATSIGDPNCFITAKALRVTTSDEMYVTGTYDASIDMDPGPGTIDLTVGGWHSNIFLAKYDENCYAIWAKGLISSDYDLSHGLDVDISNNVCLTGSVKGSTDLDPSSNNYLVANTGIYTTFFAVYDIVGNLIWVKEIKGNGASAMFGTMDAVTIHSSGDQYFVGGLSGSVDFDPGSDDVFLTSAGSNNSFIAKYWSVEPTGLSDNLFANSATLFPNPSSGTFNITRNGSCWGVVSYKIIDSNGRVVNSKSYTSENSNTLKIEMLEPGFYSIILTDSKNTLIEKFVIDAQ